MWVPSWDDRSIWLRPGSKHLFGRLTAKPQGVQRHHHVAHKSVSRKHLWFIVGGVDDAASAGADCDANANPDSSDAYLSSRSSVTIVGEGKTGTWLDEQRLPVDDQTRTLSGTKHAFRLGSAETTLVLEWRPVVIAFSTGVSRAARANGTALSAERATFAGCDFKLVAEYIPDQTTHTIAKKRNTGAVLHALVQGSWVVTVSFVRALAAACKQDGQEEDGTPRQCLLEEDFGKHWPREDEHIVPASTEPSPRDDSWLKPDPARAELFRDYTFVFMDSSQHDTLTSVIAAAAGKTRCFEFTLGETSIKSVVDFVKALVGRKDSPHFSLSEESSPGGIVIVRMKDTEKFSDVHAELDQAFNQRSIEQAELLDIVLSVNTNTLRQPAPTHPTASTGSANARPSTSSVLAPSGDPSMSRMPVSSEIPQPPRSIDHAQEPAQAGVTQGAEDALAQPPAKKRRRFVTKKLDFSGFDDFEPSSIPPAASKSPGASNGRPNEDQTAIAVESMHIDVASQVPSTSQRIPQKRPAPAEEEEKEENAETDEQRHERMFPGQAAAKRRKLEEAKQAAAAAPKPTPASEAPIKKDEPKASKAEARPKKGKKAVDETRAKMLAKREAQEEEHRRDEEDLQKGYKDQELPFLGDAKQNPEMFAQMELPVRVLEPSITVSDNPAWAGRLNYKKFKKRHPITVPVKIREASEDDSQRQIIVLEDRSTRPSGLGEEYWLEHGNAYLGNNKQKKGSQTASQGRLSEGRDGAAGATFSLNHGKGDAHAVDDDEERAVFRRRLHSSRQMDQDEAEANAMFETSMSINQSTLGTETQRKSAGKRPATTQLTARATKQARTVSTFVNSRTATPTATELSDDDDDPRAFRRRRR